MNNRKLVPGGSLALLAPPTRISTPFALAALLMLYVMDRRRSRAQPAVAA